MKYNFSRKIENVSVFEFGKAYYNLNGEHFEDPYLGIAMSNTFSSTLWKGQNEKVPAISKPFILLTIIKKNKETKELKVNPRKFQIKSFQGLL